MPMKAAVQTTYGFPRSVLEVKNVEKPMLVNGRVMVQVAYTSVNRTDCGFLTATPFVTRFFSGITKPRVPIRGCEYSGKISAVGEGVEGFNVGDRVFGFDDINWGGQAQYKIARTDKMFAKIPANISYEQAAASTEGAHYALGYCQIIAKLGAKKVLVHGATGAIGSAAVQILKAKGFYVAATSTTKNVDLVKGLGANIVIDHQKTDFTLAGNDFDVVFDAVGKSDFASCKKLLKKRGLYIATDLGPFAQNPLLGMLSPLFKFVGAKRVLFPLPTANKAIMDEIVSMLDSGAFVPVIDKIYKLDLIVDAYEYVLTGQKIGNVLVEVGD